MDIRKQRNIFRKKRLFLVSVLFEMKGMYGDKIKVIFLLSYNFQAFKLNLIMNDLIIIIVFGSKDHSQVFRNHLIT